MVMLFALIFLSCGTVSTDGAGVSFPNPGQFTWTVPEGVTSVSAKVVSGYVQTSTTSTIEVITEFPVTSGDVYYIFVGGDGNADGTGGFNGGGQGYNGGFGGAGASDIRTTPDLSSRIVVAGGSGGGYMEDNRYCYGDYVCYFGGGGGCPGSEGLSGEANPDEPGSSGGGGGTQTAGGVGGYYNDASYVGGSGALGTGGNAAVNTFGMGGGGGGGGYYGGGGGSATAGGGGSSYSLFPFKCYSGASSGVYLTWAVEYTVSFEYTGEPQSFRFPNDVTWAVVNVSGAQGQPSPQGVGGLGSHISVNVSLILEYPYSYGDYFYIDVGGQHGYNGGGMAACSNAGGGGGGSKVYVKIWNYVLQNGYTTYVYGYAGGGGGAGYSQFCNSSVCGATSINGGSGGITTGTAGLSNPMNPSSTGGIGGTQTSGGSGGYYNASFSSGLSGIANQGGNGAIGTCGGGGGGGLYGGGGGSYTGGGGGSSFSERAQILNEVGAFNSGDGVVTITFWSAEYNPDSGTHSEGGDSKTPGQTAGEIAGIVVSVVFVTCFAVFCCGKDNRGGGGGEAEEWVAMPRSVFNKLL